MTNRNFHHTLVLICCLLATVALAQAPRSRYDPMASEAPAQQSSPHCEKDYGQMIEDARAMVLETTIEDVYFWSNIVAIVFAFSLGACSWLLMKERTRREIIASECLTWYHNELVAASRQIEGQTAKYESLKTAFDRQPGQPVTSGEAARPDPSRLSESGFGHGYGISQSMAAAGKQEERNRQSDQEIAAENRKLRLEKKQDIEVIESLKHQVVQLGKRQEQNQNKPEQTKQKQEEQSRDLDHDQGHSL